MHDAQCALDALILQIEVERPQLRSGQHALVDEGAAGKAWEIDGFLAEAAPARSLVSQLVLDALAHHVDAPLQVDTGGTGDEQLPEGGHGVAGEGAQR